MCPTSIKFAVLCRFFSLRLKLSPSGLSCPKEPESALKVPGSAPEVPRSDTKQPGTIRNSVEFLWCLVQTDPAQSETAPEQSETDPKLQPVPRNCPETHQTDPNRPENENKPWKQVSELPGLQKPGVCSKNRADVEDCTINLQNIKKNCPSLDSNLLAGSFGSCEGFFLCPYDDPPLRSLILDACTNSPDTM